MLWDVDDSCGARATSPNLNLLRVSASLEVGPCKILAALEEAMLPACILMMIMWDPPHGTSFST